jgi:glycogen synthase
MKHLIVCREYPPAPHPPGGIGSYTTHMARLLAEAGERVHVIAQAWRGARRETTESCGGNLIVHRVRLDEPVGSDLPAREAGIVRGLLQSDCPSQAFSWQTARLAERLIREEAIDLIEGPEWEAPLYYLQLRRDMGLGPERQPPCLVHLHSPAEFIARSNQWDLALADLEPLCRLEEYTIRSADALLSPSAYLAQGAAARYRVRAERISVIPYPLGDTPPIDRGPDVWARDSICYVGRLELRKGIIEWVDAAVEVARSHGAVQFEFIGSDTSLDGTAESSVRETLEARIPGEFRPRFHFQSSRTKDKLREVLAQTPAAVVPSRWDNLPYTCIEAMCTGLPVLVSPNGGMAELVRDGESGWVSSDGTAAALATTLRRFLDTPPMERAAMGRNAEAAVRRICSNQSVVEQQLELRSRVVSTGAASAPAPRCGDQPLGIVVTCLEHPERLADCAAAISSQSLQPEAVVAVIDERFGVTAAPPGWKVIGIAQSSIPEARRAGTHLMLSQHPQLRSLAFVTQDVRLHPAFLSTVEGVFATHPQVGLVSCFLQYGAPWNELDATPSQVCGTELPIDDTRPCVAIRAEAVVSGEGWSAVTWPDALATVLADSKPPVRKRYSAMALSQGGSPRMALDWFLTTPLHQKVKSLVLILKQPRRVAQWAGWLLRAAVSKAR